MTSERSALGDVLTLCPSFPSPGTADDGQSIYIAHAAKALADRLGRRLYVTALQIGDQPREEQHDWVHIWRAPTQRPIPDVFALYDEDHFPGFQTALLREARRRVDRLEQPTLWCHGYEMGGAARALRDEGHPSVGVLHYLLAQESWEYLGAGGDPLRRRFLPGRTVRAVARLARGPLRRAVVSQSILHAPWARHLPLPALVQTQLAKLHLEGQLLRASTRVVAVGEAFSRSTARFYPRLRHKIRAAPPGGPAGAAVQSTGDSDHERVRLLMVGRPTPQKGWDYLAEALHRLERSNPALAARCDLWLVGGLGEWEGAHSEYARAVLHRLRSLRAVRVRDLGRQTHQAVLELYGRADLFVMPSVYEPFGLVLLEALAAGCPVLASDADGPSDVVSDEVGWRVPFGQRHARVERLTIALREALRRGVPSAEVRDRCRERAALFRWSECAERHRDALNAACRDRTPGGPNERA